MITSECVYERKEQSDWDLIQRFDIAEEHCAENVEFVMSLVLLGPPNPR